MAAVTLARGGWGDPRIARRVHPVQQIGILVVDFQYIEEYISVYIDRISRSTACPTTEIDVQVAAEKLALLEEAAYGIRRLSVEMITYGKWGHIGGAFSMAELLAVLYFHVLAVKPETPGWDGRDRLVLSKAHGSPALYAALALRGYYAIDEIYTYCGLGGFEGHTDMTRTPGLESSGGPLGMGLSVAVGMALAMRFKENPRGRVFCILGDGETNEGNVWEAAMSAAHYHLDNLIAVIDYNKVMAKGFVWDEMAIEPFADKWRAFGWDVVEADGHDLPALVDA